MSRPHLGKLVSAVSLPRKCSVVLCTCSSMEGEQACTSGWGSFQFQQLGKVMVPAK